MDFHTHGKFAKNIPFSSEYVDWLFSEAKSSGLDALCLTEHYNAQDFDLLYGYIEGKGDKQGDSYVMEGIKVFPGMEVNVAEGGHVLAVGPMEAIVELNHRLEPFKAKGHTIHIKALLDLYCEYPVLIGVAHPFRGEGHIPELDESLLKRFHFIDLNGKDVALDRGRTERLTVEFGERIQKPIVGGSDAHQTVQYGCIRTAFENDFDTFRKMKSEMERGRYSISVHPEGELKVKNAALIKRALKEIYDLGGDYETILFGEKRESLPGKKAIG